MSATHPSHSPPAIVLWEISLGLEGCLFLTYIQNPLFKSLHKGIVHIKMNNQIQMDFCLSEAGAYCTFPCKDRSVPGSESSEKIWTTIWYECNRFEWKTINILNRCLNALMFVNKNESSLNVAIRFTYSFTCALHYKTSGIFESERENSVIQAFTILFFPCWSDYLSWPSSTETSSELNPSDS